MYSSSCALTHGSPHSMGCLTASTSPLTSPWLLMCPAPRFSFLSSPLLHILAPDFVPLMRRRFLQWQVGGLLRLPMAGARSRAGCGRREKQSGIGEEMQITRNMEEIGVLDASI